jgi:hypothetical protein
MVGAINFIEYLQSGAPRASALGPPGNDNVARTAPLIGPSGYFRTGTDCPLTSSRTGLWDRLTVGKFAVVYTHDNWFGRYGWLNEMLRMVYHCHLFVNLQTITSSQGRHLQKEPGR